MVRSGRDAMKVSVKWSRLALAGLNEWLAWVRQTPGGSVERAEFERGELEGQLARYRGRPPGAKVISANVPDETEYLWQYSNISVRYLIKDHRARMFGGVRRTIVVLEVGIRLA